MLILTISLCLLTRCVGPRHPLLKFTGVLSIKPAKTTHKSGHV